MSQSSPGLFGQLLNLAGITQTPSKESQARLAQQQARLAQQQATAAAQADHSARVGALITTQNSLQDGGQYTVAPEGTPKFQPTETDEMSARMAEAQKMTDEASNGTVALALPVVNGKDLKYVSADFENGSFTELDNQGCYCAPCEPGDNGKAQCGSCYCGNLKQNFPEMKLKIAQNVNRLLVNPKGVRQRFFECMECKCENGVCECGLCALAQPGFRGLKLEKIQTEGSLPVAPQITSEVQVSVEGEDNGETSIASRTQATQSISGLNIEGQVQSDEPVVEEFISLGNRKISTQNFLLILIILSLLFLFRRSLKWIFK